MNRSISGRSSATTLPRPLASTNRSRQLVSPGNCISRRLSSRRLVAGSNGMAPGQTAHATRARLELESLQCFACWAMVVNLSRPLNIGFLQDPNGTGTTSTRLAPHDVLSGGVTAPPEVETNPEKDHVRESQESSEVKLVHGQQRVLVDLAHVFLRLREGESSIALRAGWALTCAGRLPPEGVVRGLFQPPSGSR